MYNFCTSSTHHGLKHKFKYGKQHDVESLSECIHMPFCYLKKKVIKEHSEFSFHKYYLYTPKHFSLTGSTLHLSITFFYFITRLRKKAIENKCSTGQCFDPWFYIKGFYYTITTFSNLLKILWEMDKMLLTSVLIFFSQYFLPFQENPTVLNLCSYVVCKSFQYGKF